ncbi:hypothetical protein EPA93_34815 [Ktedonosporobacter rubrisoli]|uniref:PH domain-containing protein n=1 Tax=Ktedonosporobacter rubrisoli TaxID=2509675 RepID=A0A4P6JZ47_KTERU|nr:hypothetical protein [Ktedonosporobacter rubrisoli]QBD80865.1 hypothetical protein EPA93_34815 [Ktedonosporobacter rubrisoli]
MDTRQRQLQSVGALQQNLSEQDVLVDRPRPSAGFIRFMLLIPLGIACVFGFCLAITLLASGSALALMIEGITFALLFCGICVLFGILLLSGYRIKYVLDEQALHLYMGSRRTSSIPLSQIIDGQKTPFIARLLGRGSTDVGLCNRFRNGLIFHVQSSWGYRLYLSPSDPDMFLAQLRRRQEGLRR